jgi:hypothetical protein
VKTTGNRAQIYRVRRQEVLFIHKNPNLRLADNWLVGDSSEGCETEAEGVGPDLFSIPVCKGDWKYGCRIVLNATDK